MDNFNEEVMLRIATLASIADRQILVQAGVNNSEQVTAFGFQTEIQ
jgi:hypothetical protein